MRRSRIFSLILLAASSLALPALVHATGQTISDEQANFFERKIRPVLIEKCYQCHSAESNKIKGGLTLDTKDGTLNGGDTGPAVVPGRLDDSLLIAAIRYANEDTAMPPKGKLPASVIADFETWVKMGAPDPRNAEGAMVADATEASAKWTKKEINIEQGRHYWAYQAPKKPAAPALKNTAWPKSDIDRFVLAKLEEKGLQPVPDAQKLDLLRRVTFDLTGLPPTPDSIQAFMKDPSPDALGKVVDVLLASPRFGEYWGRHWLDVARYAESAGKDVNLPYPFAWRYRDWVIEAMNRDLPYDQFVQQQIAGDLLPFKDAVDQSEKIVATGFLAVGSKPHNERNPLQFDLEVADEQIDTFSQAFLGITVACARCHDHKFDPIPQKDYYALAGIFLSSETLYGTNVGVQNSAAADLIDLGKESRMPAGFEGITAAQRTEMAAQLKEVEEEGFDIQRQARQLRIEGKDVNLPQLLATRQRLGELKGSIGRYEENGDARILAMGVYDRRRPYDSPIYGRGEATQPGERVDRGFVQMLYQGSPPEIYRGSGRLELARWAGSVQNPQAARVMVNRMWRWLFGRGIVASVDNFGAMGEKPANPELLEHLAVRFIENGWSIKKMVREIVISRTYQLATQHSPQNFMIDPENTLCWRMSARSVDAESLRDAMLSVSGKLDFYPPEGSIVCRAEDGRQGLIRLFTSIQIPNNYRSVYLPILRDQLPEELALFDFANPSLVTGDRENTNVPSQSLYLLNNANVQSLSDAFARRVYDSAKDQPGRIANAYWLAFGRAPTYAEQQASRTFFSEYGQDVAKTRGKQKAGTDLNAYAWSSFCQALMASAEFRQLN